MKYAEFKRRIQAAGWTLAQVRCDERPTPALLAFGEEVGPDYERFTLRWEREQGSAGKCG